MGKTKIIRDPVWGNIECPDYICDVVATEEFQRLGFVSQMGFTHLVFPGATHTRSGHSVGVYHLASRVARQLRQLPAEETCDIPDDDERCFLVAALLHDIGHFPFSHALEELASFRVDHEELSVQKIKSSPICGVLVRHDIDVDKVCRILKGPGQSAVEQILHRVLDGPIDIDKCDNLRRDSYFCGVDYGTIDVDRLVLSLRLNKSKDGLAIKEKGIGPVESLIFAHYLMFRFVYWHHTVRISNAMLKRAVLNKGIKPAQIAGLTDHEAVMLLRGDRLFELLLQRKLHKRGRSIFEVDDHIQRLLAVVDADDTRTEAERMLCELARQEITKTVEDGDVLIDVPDAKRRLEVRKLDELEVYYDEPPEGENPVAFSKPRVSPLPQALSATFSANARVVRVVCRKGDLGENLVGFIRTHIDNEKLADILQEAYANRC